MRRTDGRGTSVEEALTHALADLLDCDVDKVEVRVDAPGLTDLEGPLRLDLDVQPAAGEEPPPVAAPDDDEARDLERGDLDGEEEAAAAPSAERHEPDRRTEPISAEELDDEAEAAADFVEGLLDAMELPGDLRIRIREDHAEVEVLDVGSGALIGRRGQTLEAIQELARCALQREFQRRSRVLIDAEGYRARRLEKLLEKAEEVIAEVQETGEPQRLEPMDVFERKAVHHLVAENDGVTSRSQGREPARRVVIEPE